MGKAKQKNNVLRVEIDNTEIGRRLHVTPHYIRYLLRGERSSLAMLKGIRRIILSEEDRYPRPLFAEVVGKLDRLIEAVRQKGRG